MSTELNVSGTRTFLSSTTTLLPSFDLTKVVRRVAREYPDWTPERLAAAERSYRQFLADAKYQSGPHAPELDADKVWHNHILYMEQYDLDCLAYFGYVLYHRPHDASCETCAVDCDGVRAADCEPCAGCDDIAVKAKCDRKVVARPTGSRCGSKCRDVHQVTTRSKSSSRCSNCSDD